MTSSNALARRAPDVAAARETLRQGTAAQRKRLQELVAFVRRRSQDVTDSFYEMGEALAEIHNNQLFHADGHTSFDAFLQSAGLMHINTAKQLIAVATMVPREHAVRLGNRKSYVLLRLQQASPDHPPLKEVLSGKVRADGVPVSSMSTREIERLARSYRDQQGTSRKPHQRSKGQESAAALQAALRKHRVAAVSVLPRKGPNGHWQVQLTLTASAARRLADLL